MNIIIMGSKDKPDHGLGWEKREDMGAHVFYIGPLEKEVETWGAMNKPQQIFTAELETIIIFDDKNGKKSLKAMIAALRAMLAEWEYEDDKNEPETQTGH